MKNGLDNADLGQPYCTLFQHKATFLWIGEAVVLPLSFEARIARRFTVLDAPKERLEGKVHALHHILEYLRVELTQLRVGLASTAATRSAVAGK